MPRRGSGSGFSGPLSVIAVSGIALGVVVMVMAVSVLDGFRRDIAGKVVGFGSHLAVTAYEPSPAYTENPLAADEATLAAIRATEGVTHVQAFATQGGMVNTPDQIYGIMLRGYGSDWDSSFFAASLVEGTLPRGGNDVLVSTTVARKLGLEVGGKMRTYFWQGNTYRARAFNVSGLYNTDLSDMDGLYAVGALSTVRRLNDWDSLQAGGYEVAVRSLRDIDAVQSRLQSVLPYDMMLTSVVQANPALFSWLDLLGANITLLLVIMALVSSVCIVSALLIMIFEKSSTIGLLKALGATNGSVRRVFLIKACRLVALGVVAGDAVSLALSLVQNRFHLLRLDPESYSMSVVPVSIEPLTYLLVSLGTVAVCLAALLLPTAGISRISPSQTMRVEK